MKVAATVILVCLSLAAIVSLRGGNDFNILRILPFLGGYRPGLISDGAGVAIIAITIGGILRLLSPASDDGNSEEDYEIVQDNASSNDESSKDDDADEEEEDDDDDK